MSQTTPNTVDALKLAKRLRKRHDSLYGVGAVPSVLTEAADHLEASARALAAIPAHMRRPGIPDAEKDRAFALAQQAVYLASPDEFDVQIMMTPSDLVRFMGLYAKQADGVPAGWKFERFDHLKLIVVTRPDGSEVEFMESKIGSVVVANLLNEMAEALTAASAVQPRVVDKSELKRLVSLVFGEEFQITRAVQPLSEAQRKQITGMWSKENRNYTVSDIIDAVEAAHGIVTKESST